jgi:hypothetical protein
LSEREKSPVSAARRIRLAIGWVIGSLGFAAAINYLVNPYGAWRIELFNPIFRNILDERVAIPYMIRTAQPQTLLIGDSRVRWGMGIEQGERYGVMNAAMLGATLNEMAQVTNIALGNRAKSSHPKLKRIVWGADFFGFDQRLAEARDSPTRARLDSPWGSICQDTLLSLAMLDASQGVSERMVAGRGSLPLESVAEIPWDEQLIRRAFADSPKGLSLENAASTKRQVEAFMPPYEHFRLSQNRIDLFGESIARARRAGVEAVFFVPPMSEYELEMIRQSGKWPAFQNWKSQLAEIGPYWDFSGYNAIAYNDRMFLDVIHFKREVGFAVLRRILGQTCARCGSEGQTVTEAGLLMDRATAAAALAEQDRRMRAASLRPSNYATRVSAVLAEHLRDAVATGERN